MGVETLSKPAVTAAEATASADGNCDADACTPSSVANSNLKASGALTADSGDPAVTATCDTGYSRGGAGQESTVTRTCQVDGTFSGTDQCQANACATATVANSTLLKGEPASVYAMKGAGGMSLKLGVKQRTNSF